VTTARQDPRANQKARTRAAIVTAASELRAAAGTMPTVAGAAAAAGVARATAYRYFPTQEALELEVADIRADVAAIETLLEEPTAGDVENRVLGLLDAFNPIVVQKEEHFRRALWVYLDTWLRSHRAGQEAPAVREGRRMRWLDQALGPLEGIDDDRRRRLLAALSLTLGGDALVVMKDVCALDDDEALDVLRWTAAAILGAALPDANEAEARRP
jgi:AcrR family transcriptional regulator